MNNVDFEKVLLESAKDTTEKFIGLNESYLAKDATAEDVYEYEATYKAHLYHCLLEKGVSYQNLRLEMRPDNPNLEMRHIDLWFNGSNGDQILIEVKQLYRLSPDRVDIGLSDYGISQKGELRNGIIDDIIKLHRACSSDRNSKGIMLVSWTDSKREDDLDLSLIRKSIRSHFREQEHKNNIEKVKLLWVSGSKSEYVELY